MAIKPIFSELNSGVYLKHPYIRGGGHHTYTILVGGDAHIFLKGVTMGVWKNICWKGGHHTYFVDGGNDWGVNTAQPEQSTTTDAVSTLLKIACLYK